MSNQDELFLLIKSMNKNEKGYFHKFSGIHGGTGDGNYQKLFNCLAGMKEYDEEIIRAAFKGEKMLRHLKVTKHHLKNLVIRALRNYQEDSVPHISNLMNQADTYVMLNRGLYQSAGNKILKEKEAAKTGDNFLSALQWSGLHDRLLTTSFRIAEGSGTAAQVLKEKQEIAAQYLNYSGYVYLRSLVIPMVANRIGREELKELRHVEKHDLLSSATKPLSKLARITYTEILARIYWLRNERKEGVKLLKEAIAWFDNPVNQGPGKPINPIYELQLLLNFTGRDDTAEMGAVIARMKNSIMDKTNALTTAERNLFQGLIYGHEMRMEYLGHRYEAVLRSAHKLELHYKKFPASTDEETPLLTMKAMAHTALRQYTKALDLLNTILTHEFTEQSLYLLDAYLLNIVVHLELGNFSILKRQFTLAENFAKKSYSDTHYVWLILKHLGQVAKAIEAGDAKARRARAGYFLKALRTKNIPDKEYLENWLETLK